MDVATTANFCWSFLGLYEKKHSRNEMKIQKTESCHRTEFPSFDDIHQITVSTRDK